VVLDLQGSEHEWTGFPRIEWRPSSIAETALVVCIASQDERHQIQRCRYEGGSDVIRYRTARRVLVVEAISGRAVSDEHVFAPDPRQCERVERASLRELSNDLEWGHVEEYLLRTVQAAR